MTDGGYYAIKGFAFQFDRTVLEILNSSDDHQMVSLENIQDINTDSFVMQIKYRESQDFSNSKIREPIVQLIEEYRRFPDRTYVLYCFFQNERPRRESIDPDRLNRILTPLVGKTPVTLALNDRITALDQQLRTSFCSKFELSFAPNYDSQFNQVLQSIMELPHVRSEELALIYYGTIIEYLKELVINIKVPSDRKTCRKEILDRIGKGKWLVFGAAFEEYRGAKAYLALVRKEFIPRCGSSAQCSQ